MAVVIPFGDAQAHGSIAKSITFRRFRGKVVLQKKPHARVPGTPGQKAQRQKFKDAWKAYHALDIWELNYCKAKAIEAQTTAALWFVSQYLTDEIPSTTVQTGIKNITDLDLPDLIDTEDDGIKFSFRARTDPATDVELGNIWDKENVFNDGAVADPYHRAVLRITRVDYGERIIPFNYPVLMWWEDFSDNAKHNLLRLPKLTMNGTPSSDPLDTIFQVKKWEIPSPPITSGDTATFSPMWYYDALGPGWPAGASNLVPGVHYADDPPVSWPNDPSNWVLQLVNHAASAPLIIPDGYRIHFWVEWKDVGEVEFDIVFPTFEMPADTMLYFYIADDFTIWWDRAMTSLAKSPVNETDLFLAQDFSLYYNKEMTQLANAPYF